MKPIATTVSGNSVRIRYADSGDPAEVTEWLEFEAPLKSLSHPSNSSLPLGQPELQYLAEVQLAALRHMQGAIGAEIQRLSKLSDPVLRST